MSDFRANKKTVQYGVGLRPPHYSHILENRPADIDWFEAISENYMDSNGRPLDTLLKIREHYPIALHGVSFSIARNEGPDQTYLQRLKVLISQVQPFLVTDHFCFTGTQTLNSHDLLPFPYNAETLKRVVENIQIVQETLGRQMLFENPSIYLTFNDTDMNEADFLVEACKQSGARMLLDVNNVFVNATNFGFDAYSYLNKIPAELIGQIHLSGHTDTGDFLFDTHDHPVRDEVWSLFNSIAGKIKNTPILLEWDDLIPEFAELTLELNKAKAILNRMTSNDQSKKSEGPSVEASI